jgi:cytochrome c556
MKADTDSKALSRNESDCKIARSTARLLLFIGACVLSVIAFAHSGASGVVKERMDVMEGIGDSMEILVDMFKGKTPFDSGQIKDAAARIRDHAGDNIVRLFPEGSLHEPSEALPEIWEDWDEFETLAMQLQQYSDALVKAADNPSQPDMMSAQGGGRGMQGNAGAMMGGGRGMMMGGRRGVGPDPEHLAQMPPQAAFMHVADTCNSCHTKFRVEQE